MTRILVIDESSEVPRKFWATLQTRLPSVDLIFIDEVSDMSIRPRSSSIALFMAAALGAVGMHSHNGIAALNALQVGSGPTFGQRYGSNPKADNGGKHSNTMKHKREATRRRNIAKRPSCTAGKKNRSRA